MRPDDVPMANIEFTAHDVDEEMYVVSAMNCEDFHGRFNFEGTVNRKTSRIRLIKQYINAHRWRYDGVMTPFGIAGTWGFGDANSRGSFWLFKSGHADQPSDTREEQF